MVSSMNKDLDEKSSNHPNISMKRVFTGSSSEREANCESLSQSSESTKMLTVNEETEAILRMQNEKLIDSIIPIKQTIIEFKEDIIEESTRWYQNAHLTIKRLKRVMSTVVPEWIINAVKQQYGSSTNFDPLPLGFRYSFLFVSHVWSIALLTFKCYGEWFAGSNFGYAFMSYSFGDSRSFTLLIYIFLPVFAILVHKKTPLNSLTITDRRLLLLIFSFIIGAGTHYILLNWVQPEFDPPPFYSPGLVALLIEFVGPSFRADRQKFLCFSVGVATVICLAYGVNTNTLTLSYIIFTFVAATFSIFGVQSVIAAFRKNPKVDMMTGHVMLPINSMYNQLATTILFGDYVYHRNAREAVPDSIEEQYSLLAKIFG